MLHTKSVDLEEILMENDELIELSFSLGIIVGRELKDKYGIDMRIKGNVVLFTKDELAKVEEVKIKDSKTPLKGIERLPNLRKLSIESTTSDEYEKIGTLPSINDDDIDCIEKCKNLEELTIVNQTAITKLDLGKLTKLKQLNIHNNTNLETIYGIDKLTELKQLSCYGNISLQNIENLDKAIIQNKDSLEKVNLDVMLFPKAIGYNPFNGSYNQEAMNAIEYINGGITGSKTRAFTGDKVDDKVTWTESLNLQTNVTIGMHSMLKMHNKACQILHDILPRNSSTFDTVVAVERYLAENVIYDDESLNHNHTRTAMTSTRPNGILIKTSHDNGVNGAYDCLIGGSCVCQGYTRGEQYLLGLKGIKTREVACIAGEDNEGYSDSSKHRVPGSFSTPKTGFHSIVRIDGCYSLYSDPCWNACRYQKGDKSMPYTMLTKDEIRKTHTLSSQEANVGNGAWPEKRSRIAESVETNRLFRNSRTSEVSAQRGALQKDVIGIVRDLNGNVY